jgi:hypothetical protein
MRFFIVFLSEWLTSRALETPAIGVYSLSGRCMPRGAKKLPDLVDELLHVQLDAIGGREVRLRRLVAAERTIWRRLVRAE